MLGVVYPHGFERIKVDLLDILQRGFDNYLVLVIPADAVGVLAEAGVARTAARLHVSDAVGLSGERAEERGRVEGARAFLKVIRLYQGAALLSPVLVQF